MIKHVVLFSFNGDASAAQIGETATRFAALCDSLDIVKGFSRGTDISVEGLAAGFTHGFILDFESVEDRDRYLPHPRHVEFTEFVKPLVSNVLVFDYDESSDI